VFINQLIAVGAVLVAAGLGSVYWWYVMLKWEKERDRKR
jgi:hypothetical protein